MPFIYKLENDLGDVYYGSTSSTLETRLRLHKSVYENWLNGGSNRMNSAFQVLRHPSYRISVMNEFSKFGITDKELTRIEYNYIKLNPCCNIRGNDIVTPYCKFLREIDRTHHGKPKHNEIKKLYLAMFIICYLQAKKKEHDDLIESLD